MIILLIIFLIIFLLLAFYLAIQKPTAFIIFYVLTSTKFLGFFDISIFIINGIDAGFFLLNIIAFFTAFVTRSRGKIEKFIAPMYLVVAILFFLGVLIPLINDFGTIKEAIISAKNFLSFSLLFYIFGRAKSIKLSTIIKFLKLLGCYLAFVMFIYSILTLAPPHYIESYSSSDQIVRVYFPTYISLCIFIFYVDWINRKLSSGRFIFIFLYLWLAIIMTDFFALTMGTLSCLGFIYIVWQRESKLNFASILKTSFFCFLLLYILFITSETIRGNILSTILEILDGSSVSLSSRDVYNEFRWDAINDNPYLGVGFVNQDSSIMEKYSGDTSNDYMRNFGVIDSGYVDLLVRFGYIGTVFYLVIFSWYILKTFKRSLHPYSLAMSAFLLQYYMVNYTWSVFSYAHGIIPMILALYILFNSEKELLT